MNKLTLCLLGLLAISAVTGKERNYAGLHGHGQHGSSKAATVSASSSSVKPSNSSNASNSSSKLYLKPFYSMTPGSVPLTQISVGNQSLIVTVDAESPTTVILSGNSSPYNYMNSNSSSMLDVFRYRDGSNQAIGYYVNDYLCYAYSDASMKTWNQTCAYVDFLAASFNTASYG